ncbi:MAG: hypothetical protein FJ217_16695 [Ignavibacteria bacterium]|nr:hypothetical protein [Ignavibacteria bacterium]
MNHERFEELINTYIDSGLSDIDSASVFAHLSTCPSCRELLAGALRVRAHISRERLAEVPASLDARIARSIRATTVMEPDRASFAPVRHPRTIYSRIGVAIQLLTAAILLVFLFSIRLTSPGDQRIPVGQMSTIRLR